MTDLEEVEPPVTMGDWEEVDEPTVTRPGRPEPRYGRVAAEVIRSPTLSCQAKALYALLATYADDRSRKCFPRQSVLAEQLGCAPTSIQRWMAELRDAGLVDAVAQYRADGGRKSSNYVLLDDLGNASWVGVPTPSDRGRATPTGGGTRTDSCLTGSNNILPAASGGAEESTGALFDAAPEPKKRKRATQIDPGYTPKPEHLALAAELGVDLRMEGPAFVDYWIGVGKPMADWDATLRNWIRRAASRQRGPAPVTPPPSRDTRVLPEELERPPAEAADDPQVYAAWDADRRRRLAARRAAL